MLSILQMDSMISNTTLTRRVSNFVKEQSRRHSSSHGKHNQNTPSSPTNAHNNTANSRKKRVRFCEPTSAETYTYPSAPSVILETDHEDSEVWTTSMLTQAKKELWYSQSECLDSFMDDVDELSFAMKHNAPLPSCTRGLELQLSDGPAEQRRIEAARAIRATVQFAHQLSESYNKASQTASTGTNVYSVAHYFMTAAAGHSSHSETTARHPAARQQHLLTQNADALRKYSLKLTQASKKEAYQMAYVDQVEARNVYCEEDYTKTMPIIQSMVAPTARPVAVPRPERQSYTAHTA